MVFGLMFGIAVYFAPYSPRWLMMQDRGEEAVNVLMAYVDLPDKTDPVLTMMQLPSIA